MVGSGPMTWEVLPRDLLPDLIRQSWKSELHLGAERDTFREVSQMVNLF